MARFESPACAGFTDGRGLLIHKDPYLKVASLCPGPRSFTAFMPERRYPRQILEEEGPFPRVCLQSWQGRCRPIF